jgi:hypothetical protein
MNDLDRRVNERVNKETRKVYKVASFIIAACVAYLVWGV